MNKFSVTILGSGTMVPTKERNPAGFLVEVGGKKILLDCGHGTIRRLVDYGYDIQDIDYVFVSHFHTDHFSDAFSLVHSRWVDDLYNGREHSGLTFWCPTGTQARFKLWRKIFWVEPKESYPLVFKEGPRKMKIGDIKIEIFEVKHVRWFQSVGIIIEYQGKKLVYTGDIGSDNDLRYLAKKAKDSDLLITENSVRKLTPNHYTIDQVKELKEAAGAKKVLVFHVRQQRVDEVKKAVAKEKDMLLKKDGEIIKLI